MRKIKSFIQYFVAAILFAVLLFITCSLSAQTIVPDGKGNFTAIKAARDSTKVSDKPTGGKYTDLKGNTWDVFKSSTGRYYALVTSKNGNQYRKYLDKSPAKKVN